MKFSIARKIMIITTSALVLLLGISLLCPQPVMPKSASARDDGTAHVHARLNSKERKTAIDEARCIDAAARKGFSGMEGGDMISGSRDPDAYAPNADKGKTRLNFTVDMDGRVNGEGDLVYPFYNARYTAVFLQAGLSNMSGMDGEGKDGRGAGCWISNFGLGQRWFPAAELDAGGKIVDPGNWMLGYTLFCDNDVTRSRRRWGIGIEARYDWISLASTYYLPLFGKKGYDDFDGALVKKGTAQGWGDVQVKGSLPLYGNLTVTGAYTWLYGNHAGLFSAGTFKKSSRAWSYRLEYTPIPPLSAFATQRSTERGGNDTEFGLLFTYHFQMPREAQSLHGKAAMRAVSACRS